MLFQKVVMLSLQLFFLVEVETDSFTIESWLRFIYGTNTKNLTLYCLIGSVNFHNIFTIVEVKCRCSKNYA